MSSSLRDRITWVVGDVPWRKTEPHSAFVLAMVCAAKSDGQITRDEQDSILKQLDHVTQEEAAMRA